MAKSPEAPRTIALRSGSDHVREIRIGSRGEGKKVGPMCETIERARLSYREMHEEERVE